MIVGEGNKEIPPPVPSQYSLGMYMARARVIQGPGMKNIAAYQAGECLY